MLILHAGNDQNYPRLSRTDLLLRAHELGFGPRDILELRAQDDLNSLLIKLAEKVALHEPQVILSSSFGDLFACSSEVQALLRLLLSYGLKVERPNSGLIDFGLLREEIVTMVDGDRRRHHGEKIRAGVQQARRAGRKLGAPLGNRNKLGKKKAFDERTLDAIKRYQEQGFSLRQIASFLGISHSTVARYQRVCGSTPP